MRIDSRACDELRKVSIKKNYIGFAEGSCLIKMGNTQVICTASIEETVPAFLRDKGQGWVTSEYGMLPRSCKQRVLRDSRKGSPNGRTFEIQRLIGRVLRGVVDLKRLGERTVWIDCDVVQADGGTRCASITGGFVALAYALYGLKRKKLINELPLTGYVAAVSVGIIDGMPMLDLNYEEDSKAEVDMNIVMTDDDRFIEIQGTAEGKAFNQKQLAKLLSLAQSGIKELVDIEKKHISHLFNA